MDCLNVAYDLQLIIMTGTLFNICLQFTPTCENYRLHFKVRVIGISRKFFNRV